MYSYIKGILVDKGIDYIVVDAGGIGYQIAFPSRNVGLLPECGQEVKISTYLLVREDIMALYGFLDDDEKHMFLLLLGVSGIGPKGALSVIGACRIEQLISAIATDNYQIIAMAPGIGKKTAQRVILELKEKIKKIAGQERDLIASGVVPTVSDIYYEACNALIALGYSSQQVQKAVMALKNDEVEYTVEEIIRQGLKILSGHRG